MNVYATNTRSLWKPRRVSTRENRNLIRELVSSSPFSMSTR
ncbi:hypothetical protein Bhyg_06319 [Pseudolycoriella hygida]|uniref:Uncharacterized protein n=1 Tax=Pseudolycoriella hygida TaxID=35572 RepID=A0A9Q0S2Q5_9DIPT|nr:hypothetical protein Bhyg_06319 [Pseudolycoriella hygida]